MTKDHFYLIEKIVLLGLFNILFIDWHFEQMFYGLIFNR